MRRVDFFRISDSGLWCCCLLPGIAAISGIEEKYLLLASMLLTFWCYSTHDGWNFTILTMMSSVACMCALIWQLCVDPRGFVWYLACCMLYMYLLMKVPAKFPGSFTLGESALVLQLYILMLHRVFTSRYDSGKETVTSYDSGKETVTSVIFLGVHVAVLALWFLSVNKLPPLLLWPLMIMIGLLYCFVTIVFYIGVLEMQTLFMDLIYPNMTTVCFWTVWLAVSVLVVCWCGYTPGARDMGENTTTEKASQPDRYCAYQHSSVPEQDTGREYQQIQQDTDIKDKDSAMKKSSVTKGDICERWSAIVRKFFHIAMLGVYIPGLMICPDLLYIASLLVAAIMIILEAIRVMRITPVGEVLEQYLVVFLDEQDCGPLILTPIHLLIGCSAPLWCLHTQKKPPGTLAMYSGLISVGIGDTAASLIGRKFGKHKWPDSMKSIEGTSAAVISQILAIHCLQKFNIAGAAVTMEMVVCVILISLLEAFSTQIDNLVVPVFAWLLFTALEHR